MTKFKIGSVQEFECMATVSKSIHVHTVNQTMFIELDSPNTPEMKELSNRIEKAIKREVNRKDK